MADSGEGTPGTGGKRIVALLPHACIVLVLIVHFVLLMTRYAPAIAAPDANGYWAQGSLLFTTGRTWFAPEADTQYVGVHWLLTPGGRYFSRYPPGLAVLAGLVYGVLGFKASVLVNPVLATLTLAGLYLLAKRLMGAWWALVAVAVLAVNPVFNQQAIWCFAHVAVTAPLVWGLVFLVRWSERGRLWEIFVAGLLFGCIPAIRYPEALFGLGVAVFVLWHARERARLWQHAALGVAGAAVPIVPLLVRNQLAFGAFYRTGYSLTNEQTGFGWDYFRQHFIGYVRGLNSDGVGLFFALGVIGIVAMCAVRRWRRYGVLLALLVVPLTLLYMAYYWGGMGMGGGMGGSMTMRFLLPTFVCYALAGTWLLRHVTREFSTRLKAVAIAVVLALQFIWGGLHTSAEGRQLRYEKRVLVRVTDALEEHVQHGDVVIATEPILQHLDFVRRWRLVDPMAFRSVGNMPGGPGGPGPMMPFEQDEDDPMPMQRERLSALAEKYAGLDPRERAYRLTLDMDEWAGDHAVYFVGPEEQLERLAGAALSKDSFRIVARITLPEAPSLNNQFGPPGMGGMPGPRRRQMPGAGGGVPGGVRGPGGPGGFGGLPGGGGFPPGQGAGPPRMGPGGMGGPMGGPGFQNAEELVIAEWIARPPRQPQISGRRPEQPR